jgi:hypothetical protein
MYLVRLPVCFLWPDMLSYPFRARPSLIPTFSLSIHTHMVEFVYSFLHHEVWQLCLLLLVFFFSMDLGP